VTTDASGRRYFAVPVFPDGPLKDAFVNAALEPCADCGQPIRHGLDRYFQRNDATDGSEPDETAALLMALTFDFVCGPCGDAALYHHRSHEA
jgi:hypothetical protein